MWEKYKLLEDGGYEACSDKKINGVWRKGVKPKETKNMVHSLSYKRWNPLMVRTSGVYNNYPHYVNVEVEAGMKDYTQFTEWYISQKGYGVKGYSLDKDIFSNGNYTFNGCVLVPTGLNMFVVETKEPSSRYNGLPLGIYIQDKEYRASTYNPIARKKIRKSFKYLPAAMEYWEDIKTRASKIWLDHLVEYDYPIDNRILDWLSDYKFEYSQEDWDKYSSPIYKL